MGWVARGTMAAAAVSASGVAAGRVLAARSRGSWPDPEPAGVGGPSVGWQVVTVNRPRTELMPGGRLPEPLARLGGAVEVHLREAPGGRGTELAARPRLGTRSGGTAATGLPGLAAHLTGDDPRLLLIC